MSYENMFKTEVLEKRIEDIRNNCMQKIDRAMDVAAEKLDKTADKIHSTAHLLRENNSEKLKNDASDYIKNNPKKVAIGALIVGFLISRILK